MYRRMEIYYLSIWALAQQMEKKQEYEAFLADNKHNQAVHPPLGAMEVDVKTWQLDEFIVNCVVVLLLIHLIFSYNWSSCFLTVILFIFL